MMIIDDNNDDDIKGIHLAQKVSHNPNWCFIRRVY